MGVEWIWNAPLSELTGEAEYVASQSFVDDEVTLLPGDLINKKAHSVRSLRQLHDQRYLALKSRWDYFHGPQEQPFEHGPPAVETPADQNLDPEQGEEHGQGDKDKTEEGGDSQSASDEIETAPADATQAYARHEGFGKYAVMIGETKVARGLTRDDADAQAKELNVP
jgi:hypothetical protein